MSSATGTWLGRGLWSGSAARQANSARQHTVKSGTIATTNLHDVPCESGEYLSAGTRLFHDGDQQPPRLSKSDSGKLTLRTQGFDGSYVSVVAELDPADAKRIAVGTDLVIHLDAEATPAIPAFIRAHFSNEEGREVLHDLIVVAAGPRDVRFNLDGLRIPVDLATIAWVDVIFSDPAGTELVFTQLTAEIAEQ